MQNGTRINARPGPATTSAGPGPGLHSLGLDPVRDALLYVPARYRPTRPAPFVLSLHGAGGDAQAGLYPLQALADSTDLVLLSVASRGATWDAIGGAPGPDIARIDRALGLAFARITVDVGCLATAGFSDGASYALSVGLANGDLFGHVMAFSPGFIPPAPTRGRPRVFISHGVRDTVLPIDYCSRRIVPMLRRAKYEVTYREFDGPHTVPDTIVEAAAAWFVGDERGSIQSSGNV